MKPCLIEGVVLFWLAVFSANAPAAETKVTAGAITASSSAWPAAEPAALERWQAKRFGMFIHWGPVTLTGHEIGWSRGDQTPVEVYDNLYKEFNPTNVNVDDWVRIAKAAGMKYIILTAKHHDGFCLWDTKFTDYNIMHTPFHRDVVKELAAACKQHGIAFGAYYSTCDWHHPDFPLTSPGGEVKREKSDLDAYNRYLLSQIRELVTNYGPLITIWNDIPQLFEGRGADTIKLVRSLQSDILINDRTGDGGDYDTPEQRVGKYQHDRPWETCMTICQQWSWKPNDEMKSLAQCLKTLVTCAGGDGNLLFNVGPMPSGEIEPRQVERLKEMGAWLTKNGESIYGTRGGPWKPTNTMASTRNGNTIYLHILRWKGDVIELTDIARKIKSASLLGGGTAKVRRKNGKLYVSVPRRARDAIDTIVELKLDGSAMDLPALEPLQEFKSTASNVFQGQDSDCGPQYAFDDDGDTRWATDPETKQAWIAADFGRSRTVRGVRIKEAYAGRVQKFEFQYREGDRWKTVFSGTTLDERFQKSFEPVRAREFRLNILDATDGPTISELEFLEK
ncbi:MAG: Alpha-L-fucosidase [Pedosphaera sp.]|nr:Alpha-L-fucosidase [Pedosphaera sp.]